MKQENSEKTKEIKRKEWNWERKVIKKKKRT